MKGDRNFSLSLEKFTSNEQNVEKIQEAIFWPEARNNSVEGFWTEIQSHN